MMRFKNILPLVCLMAGLILILSCKAKKIKTQVVEPVEKSAFYTLDVSRDTVAGKTTFVVKDVNVADAKTRYTINEAKTKQPYCLKIEITYKNNSVVIANTDHPLFKHLEIYSESGQIEAKLISLQHAELVFRVPYFEDYKKIKIVEVINFKESSPVILKK